MLVTVFADASHCPETKAAGYGCFVKSSRISHDDRDYFSGPIKTKVEDNVCAEMMACVNGVFHAIKSGKLRSGDHVLLQCDCISALRILTENSQCNTKSKREAVIHLKMLMRIHNFTLGFRHVKGHSGIQDARSAVNRQCDKLAREHMQAMRQKFRNEKNKKPRSKPVKLGSSKELRKFKASRPKGGSGYLSPWGKSWGGH